MAQIPEKLVNFRAYAGAGNLEVLGLTDVEMPSFQSMTESIAGAGIAGEFDSPVIGHYQSMVLKLKWRTFTEVGLRLLASAQHAIDLRGSVQVMDSTSGQLVTQSVRVNVRGSSKGFNPGKFEPGKPMESDCDIEVARIEVWVAGVQIIELDKFNMIFRVGGVDQLRQVRVDMGGN